ncbi:MAG: hypothetical protein DHS80DRAFT_24595 [Piptocephalis tieghemiana]|nr:MAG: hypothetical protein DHS80DRAFT_24595 [Piptocephalis tieghemiana]
MPSDTASLLLTLTPILVSINTLSIILLIPVIIAYRSRGPLPTPLIYYFAIGLMVRHFNSMIRFLTFGSLLLDTPVWYCLVRKAIIVYVSKAGIFFAAFFAFRIWLVACAAPDNWLVRHFNLERWMTILSVVLPIIPTLLSTLPQIIDPPPVTDTSIPYVCKSGFLRQWQIYAVGAPITLPPTLLAIYCVGSILHQHCVASVMTQYRLRAAAPSSGMSIRVLLITLINVINSLYYCYFEVQHAFNLPPGGLMSQTYINGRYPVDMGDFIVAAWGIITFVIFGTAKESMDRTLHLLGRQTKPKPRTPPSASRPRSATYQFSCLEQGVNEHEQKNVVSPMIFTNGDPQFLGPQKDPPKAISSVVVPRRRLTHITRIVTPFHTPLMSNHPFTDATTSLSERPTHPNLVGGMGKRMVSKEIKEGEEDDEKGMKKKGRDDLFSSSSSSFEAGSIVPKVMMKGDKGSNEHGDEEEGHEEEGILGTSTGSSHEFISRTRSSSGVSLGLDPPGPFGSPPMSVVRRRVTVSSRLSDEPFSPLFLEDRSFHDLSSDSDLPFPDPEEEREVDVIDQIFPFYIPSSSPRPPLSPPPPPPHPPPQIALPPIPDHPPFRASSSSPTPFSPPNTFGRRVCTPFEEAGKTPLSNPIASGPTELTCTRPTRITGTEVGTEIAPLKGRKVSLAAFGMPSSSPEDNASLVHHVRQHPQRSSTFSSSSSMVSTSPFPFSHPQTIMYPIYAPSWPWSDIRRDMHVTSDFTYAREDWHRRVSLASSLWSESDLAGGGGGGGGGGESGVTSRRGTRVSLLSLTMTPQDSSEAWSTEDGMWMAQELLEEGEEVTEQGDKRL